MPRLTSRQPRYCCHKQSGLACVYLDGERHMLGGAFGSNESRAEYDRLVARWLANKRHLPDDGLTGPGPTIAVVIQRFWEHAEIYYRQPDGKPSKELKNFRITLRHLNRLNGGMPAGRFGPNALRAWRDGLVAACEYKHPETGATIDKRDWSRRYVNTQLRRVRQVFKWAAAHELIPIGVYHALTTVEALKKGRTVAREIEEVKPVQDSMVAAILESLPSPVRALVELEGLTGARGGELLQMRRCDLTTGITDKDSGEEMWIYKPPTHKNQWRGKVRKIPLGPRAQKIIEPFLKVNAQACLFSPADFVAQRLADRHSQRLADPNATPVSQGNSPGTNCSDNPKRPPGEHYTPDTFRRAIQRTCEAVFPPPAAIARGRKLTGKKRSRRETDGEWKERIGPEAWTKVMSWRREHRFHPHQLRHTAATKLRKLFGLEAAGVVLGHDCLEATQIYAETNEDLAISVMARVG